MTAPAPVPEADEAQQFVNRALGFTFWENLFKPISPLLELTCAGLFVGGAWGRYKFYESLVYLLFRVSLMGMDKGVIWYYAQVGEAAYLKMLSRSLSWCLASFAVLAALVAGSHYGTIPFSDWFLGRNAAAFGISGLGLAAYLLAVPLMVTSELCIQANVNYRNLKYRILVPGIAVPLVTFGSAIAGRFLVPGGIGLPFCFLAGNAIGAALALWGFFRVHRPTWKDISLLPLPPWEMIRYSFPIASANIFSAFAVRVDVFMLAGLSGMKGVEVYTVVSMIGKSLISIRQSFENILLSTFSSSRGGKLTPKLRHYFNYSIWLVMNIQGLLLAAIAFFGAQALGLVGTQYATGYAALFFTALFVYLNTVTDFSALLALGLGMTFAMPLVNVVSLAVNLGLNLLWIPRWNIVGAAWALGCANLAGGVIYCAFLAVRQRSALFLWEYWRSILAAACLLGLPAAGAIATHAGLPVRIACFAASVAAVLWMQKGGYRRFNRRLSRAHAEAAAGEIDHAGQ